MSLSIAFPNRNNGSGVMCAKLDAPVIGIEYIVNIWATDRTTTGTLNLVRVLGLNSNQAFVTGIDLSTMIMIQGSVGNKIVENLKSLNYTANPMAFCKNAVLHAPPGIIGATFCGGVKVLPVFMDTEAARREVYDRLDNLVKQQFIDREILVKYMAMLNSMPYNAAVHARLLAAAQGVSRDIDLHFSNVRIH